MKKILLLSDDEIENQRKNKEFYRKERLQSHLSILRIGFLHVTWVIPILGFIMRFFPNLEHYMEILNPVASHLSMVFLGIVIDRMEFKS